MHKTTLNKLIEHPEVYYIYDLRGAVFGVDNLGEYIVVVKDGLIIEDELDDSEIVKVSIYSSSEWFKLVINGEILPWICACIDKKYILKEYIKLLMTTNPLQLRKCFDTTKNQILSNIEEVELKQFNLWKIILFARFCNQIIENHKIVNFRNSVSDYQELKKYNNFDELLNIFNTLINSELNLLYKSTDELLKQEKITKLQQKK
ncbi:MAG: hypothetical protein PUJ51_02700 [Clostridiales bacterium]|uniref:hypothetical protein n=1 Tax=Terrisporobacter sp. TaxID=1965305 RepID=UPI002A517320|nr:hypothetical protein [Terrisporobacter sp.]MDD7753404.1 hypothetical protein [Clostridiales bacterium]MDY4134795.1 hypothetical protein [Terrisporobacter sp.]